MAHPERESSKNSGYRELPPGYRNGRLHHDHERYSVLRTDFDVAAYTARARGQITIDNSLIQLTPELRRDLEFLWRLEAGALGEMRTMLSSWTVNEARITAFLATWAYERYWHTHVLRDILEAGGHPRLRVSRPAGVRARVRAAYVEYALPGVASILGIVVREPVTAGHMARMAVHEGAIQVAYGQLLPRLEGEPRAVAEEIMRRRDDFLSFFRQEATARVRRSRLEAISARLHLAETWSPLRPEGVRDPDEPRAIRRFFGGEQARHRLAAADAVIGNLLPGRPSPSLAAVRRVTNGQQKAQKSPTSQEHADGV